MAAEACTKQVSMVPIVMNSKIEANPWSDNDPKNSKNFGYSSKLGMACCNNPMPNSSNVRPIINSPRALNLLFCEKINTSASAPKNNGKLNTFALSPNPKRVIIHAVMVVPMFAPIITDIAPVRDSNPALTKLTTITVVAEEDCMAVVTIAPVSMPLHLLSVTLPRVERILFPATFCKPSLISFIPKRNIASAPAKLMIIHNMFSMFIIFNCLCFAGSPYYCIILHLQK